MFSYFIAAVAAVGAICVAFDSATSQWLVQKVLNQLSSDVLVLENNLKVLGEQLHEGQKQIDERERQLKESAEQIIKQSKIIGDITLVQNNMSALVTSLLHAQQDGVNLNELFKQHLNKFETLLNNMTDFAKKNHLIDTSKQRGMPSAYLIYIKGTNKLSNFE